MLSAFQSNAFQSPGFQIERAGASGDTHDWVINDPLKKRLKYNPLTQTYILYDFIIKEGLPTKRLNEILKPYTEGPRPQELPLLETLDFEALSFDTSALNAYLDEILSLRTMLAKIYESRLKRRRQEEEIILLIITYCALH